MPARFDSSESDRSARYLRTVLRQACLDGAARCRTDTALMKQLDLGANLLAKLVVEQSAMPGFQADAVNEFRTLLADLRPVLRGAPHIGISAGSGDYDRAPVDFSSFVQAVESVLVRLQDIDSIASRTLWAKLFRIYCDYLRKMESAYLAELATASGTTTAEPVSAPLDAAALTRFLRTEFPEEGPIVVTAIERIAAGYSKQTALARIANTSTLPTTVVLRLDGQSNFLNTTVVDEFPLLQALHHFGVCVPKPWAMEPTGTVLGKPFAIVEHCPGINVGSLVELPEKPNETLCADMAAKLAKLHAIPLSSLGKAVRGAERSARESARIEIEKCEADWDALSAESPIIGAAFKWLKDHMDLAEGPCRLVHGDFGLNNLLVVGDRVTAILDWELARAGSPAYDLGYCYYTAKSLSSWREFLAAYEAAGGVIPDRMQLDFYTLLSALRLGVMFYQVEEAFDSGSMQELRHGFVATRYLKRQMLRISDKLQELMSG